MSGHERLSGSAQRIQKAFTEAEGVTEHELFVKVRPMSREGFERALGELRVYRQWRRLHDIERAAQAVVRARQVSRQAALNALPDLIRAVEHPPRPLS